MEQQQRLKTEWNITEWKQFLSSIKQKKNVKVTTNSIERKSNAQCLANEFADKLLIQSGMQKMPKPKTKDQMKNKPIHHSFMPDTTSSYETDANDEDEESLELDTESEQSYIEQSFSSGASDKFSERYKNKTLETPQETETQTSDAPETQNDGENKKHGEDSLELDTGSEQSDSNQSFRKLSGASDQFPERNTDETLQTLKETETKTSDVLQTENDGEKEKDYEQDAEPIYTDMAAIASCNETVTNEIDKESFKQGTESEQSDIEQSFSESSSASGQFPQGNNDENEEDDSSFFSKDTPVDKIDDIQKNVRIPRIRTRSKNQKRPKKSDIKIPCSSWTVLKLAEYFDFQRTVREMQIPKDGRRADQETMLHLKQKLRALQPDNLECNLDRPEHSEGIGSNIKSITVTECGTRMVIDALLIPLCLSLGVKIEVNKNIDCTYLPNCVFDYCISKEDKIIGCVEAKSINSLNANSVVQALLELLILQTNLIQIDARHIKCPVFAIVTDGHRFIYIQLLGSDFKFEHKEDMVEIHEIVYEDDVYLILHQISHLIKEGTAAMGS